MIDATLAVNTAVAKSLFEAMKTGDPELILRHYGPGAHMAHPVLGLLSGQSLRLFWRKQMERLSDAFRLTYRVEDVGIASVRVSSVLELPSPAVLFECDTHLRLDDGLIRYHDVEFDQRLWRRLMLSNRDRLSLLMPGGAARVRTSLRSDLMQS